MRLGTREMRLDDGLVLRVQPTRAHFRFKPLLIATTGIWPEQPTAPKSPRTWLSLHWLNAENKPREIYPTNTETPTFRRTSCRHTAPQNTVASLVPRAASSSQLASHQKLLRFLLLGNRLQIRAELLYYGQRLTTTQPLELNPHFPGFLVRPAE